MTTSQTSRRAEPSSAPETKAKADLSLPRWDARGAGLARTLITGFRRSGKSLIAREITGAARTIKVLTCPFEYDGDESDPLCWPDLTDDLLKALGALPSKALPEILLDAPVSWESSNLGAIASVLPPRATLVLDTQQYGWPWDSDLSSARENRRFLDWLSKDFRPDCIVFTGENDERTARQLYDWLVDDTRNTLFPRDLFVQCLTREFPQEGISLVVSRKGAEGKWDFSWTTARPKKQTTASADTSS